MVSDIHRLAPLISRRMPWAVWYYNRLRCMSIREIPFRMSRTLAAHATRLGLWPHEASRPAVIENEPPSWVHRAENVDASRYLAAADRVLAGRFELFALRNLDLGRDPAWNRDPKTGRDAPMSFGMLLNYRDPKLVGDIKYLWELNRHQHLVTLAQAHTFSAHRKYADGIRRHLETWFVACPYRRGPNWSSALEAALRLINWSICWQLLGGAGSAVFDGRDGAAFRARWLRSIRQHVCFIRRHYSRYSSANNHLIGEAVGVYVAMTTWPFWPEADRWASEVAEILEREVLSQNAADGVNREQAVGYQLFELDLLILALLAARARGVAFSSAFRSRIAPMIDYLASIMDSGGHVPMIGDSDDGYAVRLSQEEDFCPWRSVLAAGALLCHRPDFRAKAGTLDDKTRWLFGPKAEAAFSTEDGHRLRYQPKRAFRAGGYYVLGDRLESPDEIRLVADAGPLGYNTICAHGHADALSFTLSLGGREVLVDPGTYTYLAGDPWRDYFRGTAAHNTVRVDGLDQSEPGGAFLWLRKARSRCTQWKISPEYELFEAWHDGYTRLPDPVLHWRRITLNKRTRRIIIEDRLEMTGEHEVELFFHCSESCTVDSLPGGFMIHDGDHHLQLQLPRFTGSRRSLLYGSVEPIGGWISRRFDDKQPCPTIVWNGKLHGHSRLRSEIRF